MSIPRANPHRKQESSTAKMSKTISNGPSNLEKRDKDQHESQDTKHPIPTIHEENSPEKKVLQALSKFPCENYYGPHHPLFFSSHTEPIHGIPHGANPSKARIHVPLRHCSPLLLDTINTIPSKHDHHPLKDQEPY